MSPTVRQDRVLDLLDLWQRERAAGREPTPEDLCPDDPTLREALRGVIAAAHAIAPAAPTTADPAGGDCPTAIDFPPQPPGYRVLARVAAGGMGVVYAALDLAFDREIALKFLRPNMARHRDMVARFRSEARIAGRLQHPGIPPVHAIGQLPDGRPFLAMKLIRGRTLADLLAERPNFAADLPRFIQVFEQICQPVGYAHSEHIIHRDLKPANVMVGAFGEVQVMDWGLAKDARAPAPETLSDEEPARGPEPAPGDSGTIVQTIAPAGPDSALTRAGQVLGTPAYMPPEQARGEPVDARADVFALGGILCTVLTGTAPYTGRAHELLPKAARADLTAALTALDRCGADAELVALAKWCLRPAPAERPANGKAVADAVAAYRARVEERLHRAHAERAAAEVKAAEQKRKRRWQLAAFAVGTLLLAGTAVALWWDDKQATARKQEQADRARDEHDRLSRNSEGIEELLRDCEKGLRADDTVSAGVALAQLDRRVSEGGADEYRARVERHRTDLAMLRVLDRIEKERWLSVNGTHRNRADHALAWAGAFREYGIAPGTTPLAVAVEQLAGAPIRNRLLTVLDTWLVYAPDADLLALLRAADANEYRDALRRAVQARDSAQTRELFTRPEARTQPVRFAVAMSAIEAVPVLQREAALLAANSGSPSEFGVLMALGDMYMINRRGTASERVRWYQAATAVRPTSTAAWNCLGIALRDDNKLTEAEAAFRCGIGHDPAYAHLYYNLGLTLWDQGDANLDRATELFREALRLNPQLALAHFNLGKTYAARKNLDAAVAEYRAAIQLGLTLPTVYDWLGTALDQQGQFDAAVAAYRAGIRQNPADPAAYRNLGIFFADHNRHAAALAEYRVALRLDPRSTFSHNRYGLSLKALNRLDEAVRAFEEAMFVDPQFTYPPFNLGTTLMIQQKYDAAIGAFEKARALGPNDIATLYQLGLAWRAKGDLDRALVWLTRASAINPDDPPVRRELAETRTRIAARDGTIAPPPRAAKR